MLTTTTGVGSGLQTVTQTNTWDALGNELSTQDADGGLTQMSYDLAGNMLSLTDSDQNTTTWTRDDLGRAIAEQTAAGSETFAYEANSNLVKDVDFDGRERDFVYDHLNEQTAEKWMNGSTVVNTINTAYNADGSVASAGDNYSNYAYTYDGQGNVNSVDNAGTPGAPHVVLASQYDAAGNRASLAATIGGVKDSSMKSRAPAAPGRPATSFPPVPTSMPATRPWASTSTPSIKTAMASSASSA